MLIKDRNHKNKVCWFKKVQYFINVKFSANFSTIWHCWARIDYKVRKHYSTHFGGYCVLSTNHRESIYFAIKVLMLGAPRQTQHSLSLNRSLKQEIIGSPCYYISGCLQSFKGIFTYSRLRALSKIQKFEFFTSLNRPPLRNTFPQRNWAEIISGSNKSNFPRNSRVREFIYYTVVYGAIPMHIIIMHNL